MTRRLYEDALDQLASARGMIERADNALRRAGAEAEIRCTVFDIEDAIQKAIKAIKSTIS